VSAYRGLCLLAAGLLLIVAVAACRGGARDAAPPVEPDGTAAATSRDPNAKAPADETARVFDQSVVHAIEIEVPSASLRQLIPGGDDRVRARLTFDGTVLEDVGLRLKAGEGSRRPLDDKPGFSVDTDSFVNGRNLSGVTRFTLGNAVTDPSFVVEPIVYEVYRRAGAIAPRTALARVRFNGDVFGLYVLREGYDKNFLRRTFGNPDGNLYEGAFGVDITDVDHMDAKTNEKGDRADLRALARVVAETPEESYFTAIGSLVDLDRLLTFWAVEAIVHHWDGLIAPNNYYVYHDPTSGKLVFLAYGADWSMLDPTYPVFTYPGEKARMGGRLWDNLQFHGLLRARFLEVLDRYWDTPALLAQADRLAGLVRATGLGGSRETTTVEEFETALVERRAFIAARAANVRAQLGAK
jgi:spore coat protein CotH